MARDFRFEWSDREGCWVVERDGVIIHRNRNREDARRMFEQMRRAG